MTIAQSLLPEFEREIANTRKVLERVPETHASWKPHPKSYSLGDLSLHLANLLVWAVLTLQQTELDLDPPGGGRPFPKREFTTRAALLEVFDKNAGDARAALAAASDADMLVPWSLKRGGVTVFTLPRLAVLRFSVLNHTIHHRGQLTVYLRLKDVPLPFLYGPTADEKG